jgi:tRNA-guanine transglycosylases, various specificities
MLDIRKMKELLTKIANAIHAGLFRRAYLRHLYQAGEILASRLLSFHNLHYYGRLMKQIREAVENGEFADFRARFQSIEGSEEI